MKIAGTYFRAISWTFIIAFALSAPVENQVSKEFSICQATYNEVISHIAKYEGEDAATTIWRLVFHGMDLDGNGNLGSAELALYFEMKGYIHESDVADVIHEVEAWIAFVKTDGVELTTREFVSAVEKTMKNKIESSKKYFHVAFSLCHAFTSKVPHIAESMTNLESCTKRLETSIIADKSEKAEFNSWLAIFETLDYDNDKKIEFEEVKKAVGHKLTSDEDLSLASALGHAIYGTVHHDVSDVTERGFYLFIHELLYGLKTSKRSHSWADVYDENELKGRAMLCNVIYDVRKKLTGQRDVMNDCIKSYQATKQRILGEDGVFAPEIVFTMVDSNRNGKISQQEFDTFIGSSSTLYNAIGRKYASKSLKIDQFRSIMPDKLVDDDTNKFELSSMTSSELRDAEKLCYAIITSVKAVESDLHIPMEQSFKGSGSYIMREHPPLEDSTTTVAPVTEILHLTDHNGDPIEVEIRHPSRTNSPPPDESLNGPGSYIEAAEYDVGITPAPPTRPPADDSNGLVHHMYDEDGNPIALHMNGAEIDDILYRINHMIHPPMEPDHNQPPPPQEPTTPSTHLPENSDSDVSKELMNEITKILNHEKENPATETESTEEESQLKNLLERMENGDGV